MPKPTLKVNRTIRSPEGHRDDVSKSWKPSLMLLGHICRLTYKVLALLRTTSFKFWAMPVSIG